MGSIRTTWFEPASATHTLSNPTAIPRGSSPTGISSTTSFVSGSMREIVPSNRLVTHTAPSPTAMPAGPLPTSIGSPTTSFVSGLIRETDGPPLFTTHTASNPTAIPVGFSPTGIESRISCSSGSIRVTVPTSGLVTHTASADAATDPGRSSSSTVAVTSPDSGSRTPTEFGSISELPPALRATKRDGDQCGDHGERDHRRNRLPPCARWRRDRPDERGDRQGVVPFLGTHRDHVDRLVEPLQLCLATLGEPDAVDPQGEVDDLPAREHLAGARERAEPCRDVQRAAPVAALDRHRLAGVQPDPDGERKGWIGDRLLDEALLQSHGSTDRRAR